jgi:hypothetical protein
LVAIELNTVLRDLKIIVDFGEEQYASECKGIIYVKVYPKQWVVLTGI